MLEPAVKYRTYFTNDFFFHPFCSFLVDACMKLLAHVETEGLFRKSGSVVRLKELRVSVSHAQPRFLLQVL